MEGAPLFNYEDNSESDDTEQSDARGKKSKKRRKNTPEWLQRLLKPDEAKSSEENPETNRFLEAIKSPFGRLFGIEKEELAEEDEVTSSDIEPEMNEARLPFMPTAFIDREPAVDTTVTPEEDSEPDVELPQGLLINEDTAAEIASWNPEAPGSSEPEPATPELPVSETEDTQLLTIQEGNESDVDRLRAEVESHAMASTDISPDRHVEHVGIAESRPDRNQVKEREIIVEKRGGAGAAAVGFVAAELLSRSRDKKIRREAKRLKKKVERLENNGVTDKYEAQKAQARNKQQIEQLRERRVFAEPAKNPELPKPSTEAISNRQQEKLYSPKTERVVESRERTSTSTERRPDTQLTPETPQYDRIQEEKQEILAKIQEAGEQNYAGETYYERKHEVMDEPTVRERVGVGANVAYGAGAWGVTSSDEPVRQPSSNAPTSKTKPTVSDEYKRAMVQGATTGIILLVGFVIVLILWSLL